MSKLATMLSVLGACLTAAMATPAPARGASPQASDVVRMTVTILSHDKSAPPKVAREDVIVYQGNERRPVVDWVPAQGEHAGLDLAILVDDSLDSSVGLRLAELRDFLRSLPPTTRVAVAYGAHGDVTMLQEFTTDHELAAKALRLPTGQFNGISSIYMALSDLLKRWPTDSNRHAVLLITDGIDLYRGVAESSPGLNGDLQQAIDQAERGGVTVYSLFANGAGGYRRNFFLITNGQGCLARLTLETGGYAFFLGSETPVSFTPFLQQVTNDLGQQYLLTFRAHLGKNAGFQRLRVTTELPRVELVAPTSVYIPAQP